MAEGRTGTDAQELVLDVDEVLGLVDELDVYKHVGANSEETV